MQMFSTIPVKEGKETAVVVRTFTFMGKLKKPWSVLRIYTGDGHQTAANNFAHWLQEFWNTQMIYEERMPR